MTPCLFASDLHGGRERYLKLLGAIAELRPAAVFLGGDLLPSFGVVGEADLPAGDFVDDFLIPRCRALRDDLGDAYPRIYLILGNDDPRSWEAAFRSAEPAGLWTYAHQRRLELGRFQVYGYSYVPPTPFRLKDWERYDVSRYVDPGCVPPEEGMRTTPTEPFIERDATIREDLDLLAGEEAMEGAVFLFHSPPYRTKLDRAALDGRMIDHVPLDVHVGSIAIQRFIEARQPLVTLHGHVHESARLTGSWRDRIGRTHMLSAAHDGPELALVRFELEDLESASRELR
jgi:Icc-related predicted phosphoesterase